MLDYAPNISWLWKDLPLRERLANVRNSGFKAFEFLFVTSFGLPQLVSAVEESGLGVTLFDLEIGDTTYSKSNGLLCRPEAEKQFFESLDQALEAAVKLDCHRLNALVGRGTPGMSWEAQRDIMVDRLGRAAPLAAQANVSLLVEAISPCTLPGYLVNYTRQALEVVNLVDNPSVRIQWDLYHMQLMEGNLISGTRDNLDKIGYIQIADVPGRHEPGTGEINYPNVLRTLEEAGYKGYVGLEYSSLGTDPFAWMKNL